MAYDRAFGEWGRDHLHGLGPIEIKRMFGGAGVKSGGSMFAILDDGVLWLKADEALARDLEAEGARRFTYPTKDGGQMSMAYWSLPETALDDPDEAVAWARKSVAVAAAKAAAKPKRRTKG